MFLSLATALLSCLTVAAQSSSPSVVCVAGQCLQGYSNVTIGTKLSAQGAPVSIHLLPGQYTTTTSPQLLHNLLISSSASYSPSTGFENATSSTSLPLDLSLAPGLAIYSQKLYSGQDAFSPLPLTPTAKNSSTPLTAGSLAISNNIWVAISSGSDSRNERIILWDSIPDVEQLPSNARALKSLSLIDMQSSACSPVCSGSSVCSPSGSCTCPDGFTGSACESCAPGRFGPTCQPCPSDCAECDEGISGSGRCLRKNAGSNAPGSCNCLNGQCGSNGECACNAGWTTGDNGTACAKCSSGFFLTSTGDCQVCQLGCAQCAETTGTCVACKQGFSQDANDKTKCNAVQATTSTGTPCPEGSFSNGDTCALCSPSCKTCTGPTSNDCIVCAAGQYLFNGNCVGANSDGVCEGSGGFIADNFKHICDTCGAKCTSCKIPNFDAAATIDKLQCTGCLPGFVLSQGKCIESCPTGTFLSSQDNLSCLPCDSSCSTCAGSADFCLTCTGNQLSSNGKCVTTCPQGTFTASDSCTTCHPDCSTCSGSSFNQCSSCPPDRPVLSNGRCLPTCSRAQYFDQSSSSCQACDSSCSSCSGPGSNNCLACSSSSQFLRSGSCVSATCQSSSTSSQGSSSSSSNTIIPGLGICLSDLVQIPASTGTNPAAPPLPTITGIDNPTIQPSGGRRPLEWWQILLMALGCAFICLMFILCWRRRARKQRAKRTAMFASAKRLDQKMDWRGRIVRFGERLFGANQRHHNNNNKSQRGGGVLPVYDRDSKEFKMQQWRDAVEDARSAEHDHELDELDRFISAYDYSKSESSATRSRHSTAPSSLPSLNGGNGGGGSSSSGYSKIRRKPPPRVPSITNNRLSAHSMYSEVTKNPRHMPEPRQPIRTNFQQQQQQPPVSRFSASSGDASFVIRSRETADRAVKMSIADAGKATEAEAYASSVWPALVASPPLHPDVNWVKPNSTGGSTSRNPFRQL